MRKFILKLLVLAIIIVVVDQIVGFTMSTAFDQIAVGGRGRDNYICNTTKDEILVFGSSRAVHHYNSTILEDSIGMSCYNCGDDGSGIILSYGRLLMATERQQPKIVIQDINPEFDLLKGDNFKYLGWLKARYDREGIKDVFDTIDKTAHIKMCSQMYRYNSTFLQYMVAYLFSIANDTGIKGFRPSYVEFDPMKVTEQTAEEKYEFDSIKLKYIKEFIRVAEGSKLVFVVSPIWYGMDVNKLSPVRKICSEQNIPFIDFSNNPKYVHCNKYFHDGVHLNAHGADEFTKDLVKELREQKIID